MKIIRGTLKLALILYICATLSGVYVLSASARITPHMDDDGETMLITIEKGDTLWDLCQEYLEDPLRWRELSKYNDFTNPHLIYPGEQLRIPVSMAKQIVQVAEAEVALAVTTIQDLELQLAETRALVEQIQSEIKDYQKSIEALLAAENNKKFQNELLAAVEAIVSQLVTKTVSAATEQVADLGAKVDKTAAEVTEVQAQLDDAKKKAEETTGHIKSIQENVETLLKEIEVNRKGINELNKLIVEARGFHENPSTSKRSLVFLTTAAAGIGWFAIKVIGGRQ